MKIAVNTRLLIRDKLDGIGWFTHETLKRITINHPEHQFFFIFDRPFQQEFIYSDNVTPVVAGPQSRHPILWYWWFDRTLPKLFNKLKPDLFLSQDGYLSLNTQIPQVDVIHDINFEHYPQLLPPLTRRYYRKNFPKYAQKASRLATVSEYSKADIATKYAVATDKIDVVYNGVNPSFEVEGKLNAESFKKKYSSGKDFILFVGTLHERKNIARMLEAFDEYKKISGSSMKFLIVGRKMWWNQSMEDAFNKMKYRDDVVLTGRIDDEEELAGIVSAAKAMIYVPIYEGFGVPVIESQLAKVPVITANNSCIPEIAGSGAHFVDPFSISAIADGIQKVVEDDVYAQSLVAQGAQNAVKYSWDQTAKLLWETVEKVFHA